MFKFALACLASTAVAVSTGAVIDYDKLPQGMMNNPWYNLSAKDKFDTIMVKLKEDQTAAPYRYELAPFMTSRGRVSTCVFGDEFNNEKDTKLAHQQGVVGAVTYKSIGDHPYTGFYANGSNWGLARLSESGFIIPGHYKSNPSMAVKFFSDGVRTPNFNLMISFNDQDGWSFFPRNEDGELKAFTNHPGLPKNDCLAHSVGAKFKQADNAEFSTGISSFAIRDEDGGIKGVNTETDYYGYYWPYEVQFHPNEAQVPEYVEGMTPLDHLSTIKKVEGEPLFYVYAREDPESELELIGELTLEEDMFQSYWGDTQLYFQHDPFFRDVGRWEFTDFPEKQQAHKNAQKQRYKEHGLWELPIWEEGAEIPDFPEGMTAREVVEGGILGTLNPDGWTGCPFAWLFIDQ